MRPIWLTILLLSLSNVVMTLAWYAHLKERDQNPWIVVALVSWGIAFFQGVRAGCEIDREAMQVSVNPDAPGTVFFLRR